MVNSFLVIVIVNVISIAILTYFQLGPSKLWSKVVSHDGSISLFWFFTNFIILMIVLVFTYSSIVIYWSNYQKTNFQENQFGEQDLHKPSLQFQLSDNLFDDSEMNKPGIITYDGLITLPLNENKIIGNLLIEINFPISIEKFELVKQIGVENPNIQFGNEDIIELREGVGFIGHTNSVTLEIDKVKPGAFLRFKVYTPYLESRNINRNVDYEGYYFYEKSNKLNQKEDIKGNFTPNFYKIAEFDIEKLKLLYETLTKVNPNEGTILFWTSDKNWYENNGYFIDFIYPFEKENFKIHVYRDRDNVLKVELDTIYFENILLSFKDLEKVKEKETHPNHMITITWNNETNQLYVDDELVDEYPRK